jgi:lipoprotein-releasing system permease protein
MTPRTFEFFIASRYLRAKRKQAVISVITVISIAGVAAGVMALVIGIAINNGFRDTLQRSLLGATAHVMVLAKDPAQGIANWRELDPKLRQLPHVVSVAPNLYGGVYLAGPQLSQGAEIKGVPIDNPPDMLLHLKQGSFGKLKDPNGLPGIILGSRLAQNTGMLLDGVVYVFNPQPVMTPLNPMHFSAPFRFRVVGVFESGFYDIDSAWAFTSLSSAQVVLNVGDVVNSVELHLDDIYQAPEVAKLADNVAGSKLSATTWMEQYHQILDALSMERKVTALTIGLIEIVAALNILITLVMMVMEKNREIAVLMSMGATRRQIRKIFVLQGALIGVVGTAIGLALGYAISILADHYRWLRLNEDVYSLAYVPFNPRWQDAIWIAAAAILVSLIATLYPARAATVIAPVEALRFE